MKRFVVCISTLVLLLASVTASALDLTSETISVSDNNFSEIVDAIFSGNGTVFDSNHEDITDVFCDTYANAYAKGNLTAIFNDSFMCGFDSFSINNEISSQISPQLVVGKQYSQTIAKKYTHNGTFFDGKTWYLNVTATGSMQYTDSTGNLTYVSEPTYSFAFGSLGYNFSGNIDSIKVLTHPTMTSGNKSAKFSLQVTHSVSATIGDAEQTFTTQTGTYYFEVSA